MVAENDLVVGAWRNGLDIHRTDAVVKEMLQKEAAGFSMYPPESTVVELSKLLDSYDNFSEEMLMEENPQTSTTKKRGA